MKFGTVSRDRLSGVDERLQRVAHRALGYAIYDFSVVCGYRSPEQQFHEFQAGRSKADGFHRKSKHNFKPARAIDIAPYPLTVNGLIAWEDPQRFAVLAGIMLAAAKEEGVAIRWGGDWDGDGNNRDAKLHDMPHFELVD